MQGPATSSTTHQITQQQGQARLWVVAAPGLPSGSWKSPRLPSACRSHGAEYHLRCWRRAPCCSWDATLSRFRTARLPRHGWRCPPGVEVAELHVSVVSAVAALRLHALGQPFVVGFTALTLGHKGDLRPALDSRHTAGPFESGRADAQRLGGLLQTQVEVLAQYLEAQVLAVPRARGVAREPRMCGLGRDAAAVVEAGHQLRGHEVEAVRNKRRLDVLQDARRERILLRHRARQEDLENAEYTRHMAVPRALRARVEGAEDDAVQAHHRCRIAQGVLCRAHGV
eukprot:scaffold279_cov369-Prasinococcus_capsulatus_cf.AAC.4